MSRITHGAKTAVRTVLPLSLRKKLALWVSRQAWMPRNDWWAVELVADWATRDPSGYHRFCWSHHLGYAVAYEVNERFGAGALHPSRQMLFDDLRDFFGQQSSDTVGAIKSVFEVGCSMGHLLHHLEKRVFPIAERVAGIDIDAYAIAEGSRYLQSVGSKVTLSVEDMGNLDAALGDEKFDLILCAGVLMYLTLEEATAVVHSMLRHTSRYLVLTGLAHPNKDNKELVRSGVRAHDGAFIHNLDAMVQVAGGSVLYRRWEGDLDVHGNTIYFLFCEPVRQPMKSVGVNSQSVRAHAGSTAPLT